MKVLVKEPLSSEWFAARREGITATDASAILGVHKFKTALDVYNDKLGLAVEVEASDAMKAGNYFEDGVRNWFRDVKGLEVQPSPGLIQHPDIDWLLATPDGIITTGARGLGVYEGKTSNFFAAREWEEGVPLFYQVQVQQALGCCGLDWGAIACVTGGQTPHFDSVIEADVKFFEWMVGELEKFRNEHILAMVPPAPTENDTATVKAMFPRPAEGTAVPLSSQAVADAIEYKALTKQIGLDDKRKRLLQNRIKMEIGEHEFGIGPDWRIKSSLIHKEPYQVKATDYRDFRFVKKA